MQATTHTVERTARQGLDSEGRVLLAVLCVAQGLLILDVAVVNVALPRLQVDFSMSARNLQWVSSAYTITFGGLLILGGRIGDYFGRRRAMLAALMLFCIACLGCGVAQNRSVFLIARAVQGCGAAVIAPVTLSVLTAYFAEGQARNRALAVWGAVLSGAAVVAQVVGGVITYELGWRYIFFLNILLAVIIAVVVARIIPRDRPTSVVLNDVSGGLALTGGLALLVYATVELGSSGSTTYLAAATCTAVVLLAAFVAIERVVQNPIVRLGLLSSRPVFSGNIINISSAAISSVCLYLATLYLGNVLNYSSLQIGLAFAPVTVVIVAVSSFTDKLVARFGVAAVLVAASVSTAFGIALLSFVSSSSTSYLTRVLPGLILVGVGAGLSFAPSMSLAVSGVTEDELGVASGMVGTSQQVGVALGVATFAAIAAAFTDGTEPARLVHGFQTAYHAALLLPLIVIVFALVGRPRAYSGGSGSVHSQGPVEGGTRLSALSAEQEAGARAARDLVYGGLISRAVCAFVELGAPDLLHVRGQMRAPQLAAALDVDEDSFSRLVMALASRGVVDIQDGDTVTLTHVGTALSSSHPASASASAGLVAHQVGRCWDDLAETVRTGVSPFERQGRKSLFDGLEDNVEERQQFDRSQTYGLVLEAGELSELVDFTSYERVVDVGGGEGGLLAMLLDAHPLMYGVLFDLPASAELATAVLSRYARRSEVTSGNFFDSVPAGGDLYILSHVLHDWGDSECIRILRSCARSMSDDAAVLVVEQALPTASDSDHGSADAYLYDLYMLSLFGGAGGRERSLSSIYELLVEAGFEVERQAHSDHGLGVVVARKRPLDRDHGRLIAG